MLNTSVKRASRNAIPCDGSSPQKQMMDRPGQKKGPISFSRMCSIMAQDLAREGYLIVNR